MSLIKINKIVPESSENINEKGDGPYRGFGFLILIINPTNLVACSQRE